MHTPSKYQQDFYDKLLNTDSNIFLNATAGSGKTTTIVDSIKLLPHGKKIAFFAFNKTIAAEIAKRVPSGVFVSTLHSYGVQQYSKTTKWKLDENKSFSTALKLFEGWVVDEKESRRAYCYRVSQIVDKMKLTLCALKKAAIEEMASRYGIEIFGNEAEYAIATLNECNRKTYYIDFADMLYMVVHRKLRCEQFDYVFIDEMQDLNACGQELVKKALKSNGRLIGVGDPNQAIYGFAGADVNSYNNMKTMLPNSIELPLSICYRCGKDIVRTAQQIVPHLESFETQINGEVREGKWGEIVNGDLVLCRNTRPLVALFIEFLKLNVKSYVKGRDLGTNLIQFIQRKNVDNSLITLVKELNEDRSMLKGKLIMRNIYNPERSKEMEEYDEKVKIVNILTELPEVTDVLSLVKKVEGIFMDTGDGVCLSTIHKAKGTENERVFVLCPELMPSKYATLPDEIVQEENLRYVCYTRAKEALIFVNDFVCV